MKKVKANIIKCSIGNIDISRTAIESLTVNRNFTDVSNKFSMTFMDTPISNDKSTDLELYMAGGGRSITFSYGDDADHLLYFKGTIWDYKNTFVGDIKKLEITGYVTKSDYIQNESGTTWSYNIDWNNYFNMRADTSKPWNVLMQVERDNTLSKEYSTYRYLLNHPGFSSTYDAKTKTFSGSVTTFSASDESPMQMSSILDPVFKDMFTYNTTYIKVKGPVGTIELPVPDSFVTSQDTLVVQKDAESGVTVDFVKRACQIYWDDDNPRYWIWDTDTGWSEIDKSAISNYKLVYVSVNYKHSTSTRPIVGFLYPDGVSYIQVNLSKPYAGAGIQIKNTFGVSPADVVRKLAKLEGWKIGNIVDTELVDCCDQFKMKGQSALDFITNNLVPLSVMPSGVVTTKDGKTQITSSGTGGYVPYFEKGKFYYEPLNSSHLIDRRKEDLYLGYNIPNSPVISFQVDTKGTSFYVTQPVTVSTMSLVTGVENASVSTTSTAAITNFNKVAGHNEGLDAFLGYSYDEMESSGSSKVRNVLSTLWDAENSETYTKHLTGDGDPYFTNSGYNDINLDNPQTVLNSNLFSSHLVSTLAISAAASNTEIKSKLEQAREKIKAFMIKATLSMWGSYKISPASIISVTNMVKSENKYYPVKHPTSGDYLITKQTDQIDGSGFIQTLDMYRYTDSVQNSLDSTKIDWSKGIRPYQVDLKVQTTEFDDGHSGYDLNNNNYKTAPIGWSKIGTWEGHDVYAKGDGYNFFVTDIGPINKDTQGFVNWLNDYLTQGTEWTDIGNGFFGLNYKVLGSKTQYFYQLMDVGPRLNPGKVYFKRDTVIQPTSTVATIKLTINNGSITDLRSNNSYRKGGTSLGSTKVSDFNKVYHDSFGWLNYSHQENC